MQQAHEPAPPAAFIPQPAERMPLRAPRMPQFEELPVPAQNEIRKARGEAADEAPHPQKTRTSLLQRLANVGLGRRDEDSEPPIAAHAFSGTATQPYAAYHFHRLGPYGALTNLLAMPVVSAWVMPAGSWRCRSVSTATAGN